MPTQLQGGDLNRKITVQRLVAMPPGDYHETVELWADFITIRAKQHDVSAVEAARAQEVGGQLSTRFTIRSWTQTRTIDVKDRIIFNQRVYNIVAVRERAETRNMWFEIDAVARADKIVSQEPSTTGQPIGLSLVLTKVV